MDDKARFWSFDVSALMILVGETEESQYRTMERSLPECISPYPIVGLQGYLRSYEWLLQHSNMSYFSPYGVKKADMCNMRLANAIAKQGLLDDGLVTVLKIDQESTKRTKRSKTYLLLWAIVSWAIFGGILVALCKLPNATWIGMSNCVYYATWSFMVRVIEHYRVRPTEFSEANVSRPSNPDAIYMMGRQTGCFVLEGSRLDVKKWSECGLHYTGTKAGDGDWSKRIAKLWQRFTRVGSLLLLLFIFTTIPNGTTVDQIIFIVYNILGQANVLLGQRLNSVCLLDSLKKETQIPVDTRTHTYAYLLRRYPASTEGQEDWVGASGLLPETETWRRWRRRVVDDQKTDPKKLYDIVNDEIEAEKQPVPVPQPTGN